MANIGKKSQQLTSSYLPWTSATLPMKIWL